MILEGIKAINILAVLDLSWNRLNVLGLGGNESDDLFTVFDYIMEK